MAVDAAHASAPQVRKTHRRSPMLPHRRTVAGLIDPLYNGIVGFVVVIWLLGRRCAGRGRTKRFVSRYRMPIAAALWAVFLVLAIAFVARFDFFAEIHDIDDAVEAAAEGLVQGVNPYSEPIVPRFQKRYSPDVGWTYGTYNYLPFDLLIYTGARAVLGFLGHPLWFVSANLAFGAVAWTIFQPLVRTRHIFYVPVAGTITIFYTFDNAMLTLMLLTMALYVGRRWHWHPRLLSIILLALAGLTKAYALLPFGIVALFELQNGIAYRDKRRLAEIVIALAASFVVAAALLLPFGADDVIDSALLFHTSPESREGTSSGGTLLSELMGDAEHYSLIALGTMLLPIILGLRFRNDLERVVFASVVFLMVIPKSSYAPLTVSGLFLALWLRERADAVASSFGQAGATRASSSEGFEAGGRIEREGGGPACLARADDRADDRHL